MLKDLPFYEKVHEAYAKARLDQLEEKRQEGTLRKAPGEKGRSSLPAIHPQAAKKKKKTIAQALNIVSPAPDLSSSSSDLASSRSGGPA